MLNPSQFQVNEAWIAFKLNGEPIHTEADGDFNFVALMDVASCFILTTATVPASSAEPSRLDAQRLLERGKEHKKQLPKTLFVPSNQPAQHLTMEAERQGIVVIRVPEDQLMIFIGEAREGFREQFGHGAR